MSNLGHTSNFFADIRESWPTEMLKRREPSAFFFSNSHAAKPAAIASETSSVRLSGSPSTPATATPRISLCMRTSVHKEIYIRSIIIKAVMCPES